VILIFSTCVWTANLYLGDHRCYKDRVRSPFMTKCTPNNIMWYNFFQWLAAGRWFSPETVTVASSTNKTDRHNITEIFLRLALNTISLAIYTTNIVYYQYHRCYYVGWNVNTYLRRLMADFKIIFVFISAHDDICSAWRKIVIFHTKYPNNCRASLRSAQFF
jgi:hypothetical protein